MVSLGIHLKKFPKKKVKMVVEFPTFCCEISLKRGTTVIGFIQSILSFIFMILCAAYANKELVDMSDPSIISNNNALKSLFIVTAIAITSAVQCVLSILIIFGAETNRPCLLVPWLIFNPMSIAVYIIGTLIVMIEHAGIYNTTIQLFFVGHLVVGILVTLVGGYNIITVYSFYKHLKSLNF